MVTRTDLARSHFFCDDSLISDQGWKKGRWEKWRDAPVDGYGYPIVRVRKVCRRVNYEGWRKRERERVCVCMRACACVYTIDRTRAVNLVIKDPFCYRFNRIMLSRTDRKFGGMATHTSVSVLLKFHAACVGVASLPPLPPLPLPLPLPAVYRPPTTLPTPFTIRRPSAAANHFYARSPFGGVRNSSRQVQSVYRELEALEAGATAHTALAHSPD